MIKLLWLSRYGLYFFSRILVICMDVVVVVSAADVDVLCVFT